MAEGIITHTVISAEEEGKAIVSRIATIAYFIMLIPSNNYNQLISLIIC